MADFGKLSDFLRDEAQNKAETEAWHDQLVAWAKEYDGLLVKVDDLNQAIHRQQMKITTLEQKLKQARGQS